MLVTNKCTIVTMRVNVDASNAEEDQHWRAVRSLDAFSNHVHEGGHNDTLARIPNINAFFAPFAGLSGAVQQREMTIGRMPTVSRVTHVEDIEGAK